MGSSGRSWQISISSLLLLILHLMATVALCQDDAIENKLEKNRKDLQEIKRKIAVEKEKVGQDVRKEKEISADLGRVRKQLAEKKQEAAKLQREIDQSRKRIRQLTLEIQESQTRLAEAKSLLANRLRSIYKQGEMKLISLLLSANGLHQAALNLHYLQVIAHQDRQLIRNFKTAIAVYGGKRAEVSQQLSNLNLSQQALRKKQAEIAQDEKEMRWLLAKVREDKADSLKRISELQRSSAALQTLIGQLQQKMNALRASAPRGEDMVYLKGLHFASAKGKLSWPTRGGLLSSFGRREHPRYHTFTFNKGIDIEAPVGNEIKAVFEGIVLFADWFRGYGKMAIIDHGQGFFTLYAHASELLVKVGDKVSPRQVIAKVGDSGSPEGARLHFEIRQNGKPVDPLQWLVSNP